MANYIIILLAFYMYMRWTKYQELHEGIQEVFQIREQKTQHKFIILKFLA